jgi:hypothetical protein
VYCSVNKVYIPSHYPQFDKAIGYVVRNHVSCTLCSEATKVVAFWAGKKITQFSVESNINEPQLAGYFSVFST